MSAVPTLFLPGIQSAQLPDLSRSEVRKRLSPAAIDGFFAIAEMWALSAEQAGELLGGMPRSSLYKLRKAHGTLRQDELTRISYIAGIYKALHILLPSKLADRWITRPNAHPLFAGAPPLDYIVRNGIPGLQNVRRMLDAETERH